MERWLLDIVQWSKTGYYIASVSIYSFPWGHSCNSELQISEWSNNLLLLLYSLSLFRQITAIVHVTHITAREVLLLITLW